MKINQCKWIFCLLLVLQPPLMQAADYPIRKEKKVSKLYNVNADAGVKIDNKYGSIYLTTWDESQIAIDVSISVEGKNDAKVQKRLDNINVEFDAAKALIAARTVFGTLSGSFNMQVNYTIKIPRRGGAMLENQYGNITTAKLWGNSRLECQYGTVNAAELAGDANLIVLRYADRAAIGFAKNLTVDAEYSGVVLQKANNVSFKGDYSSLDAKQVDNLVFSSDYGALTVGETGPTTIKGDYLTLRIDRLSGALALTSDYSSIAVRKITPKAGNIAINVDYSDVDLRYDDDYAFDFDVKLEYADFKSSGLNFQTRKENGSTQVYKGFYKSAGKNQVSIIAEYGTVRLQKG